MVNASGMESLQPSLEVEGKLMPRREAQKLERNRERKKAAKSQAIRQQLTKNTPVPRQSSTSFMPHSVTELRVTPVPHATSHIWTPVLNKTIKSQMNAKSTHTQKVLINMPMLGTRTKRNSVVFYKKKERMRNMFGRVRYGVGEGHASVCPSWYPLRYRSYDRFTME